MNLGLKFRTVALATTVILAGCATPQAALDQANNGAALAASLQSELQDFRRIELEIAQGRIDSIRQQRLLLSTYEADAAFDERIQGIAGKSDVLNLYTSIRDLSDSRNQDELDSNARNIEMEGSFAKLLGPLPDINAGLKGTQDALAALGVQLSSQERLQMTAEFAQEIKKAVDANKAKSNAAAASTPAATAQPAAAVK